MLHTFWASLTFLQLVNMEIKTHLICFYVKYIGLEVDNSWRSFHLQSERLEPVWTCSDVCQSFYSLTEDCTKQTLHTVTVIIGFLEQCQVKYWLRSNRNTVWTSSVIMYVGIKQFTNLTGTRREEWTKRFLENRKQKIVILILCFK